MQAVAFQEAFKRLPRGVQGKLHERLPRGFHEAAKEDLKKLRTERVFLHHNAVSTSSKPGPVFLKDVCNTSARRDLLKCFDWPDLIMMLHCIAMHCLKASFLLFSLYQVSFLICNVISHPIFNKWPCFLGTTSRVLWKYCSCILVAVLS